MDESVIGAASNAMIYDSLVSPHPQADRSYFRALRMGEGASCGDLENEAGTADDPRPGSWLGYEPRYDPAKKP